MHMFFTYHNLLFFIVCLPVINQKLSLCIKFNPFQVPYSLFIFTKMSTKIFSSSLLLICLFCLLPHVQTHQNLSPLYDIVHVFQGDRGLTLLECDAQIQFSDDELYFKGCNGHTGDFELNQQDGTYEVGMLTSTLMYCDHDHDQEITDALRNGRRIQVVNGYLKIFNEDNQLVLTGKAREEEEQITVPTEIQTPVIIEERPVTTPTFDLDPLPSAPLVVDEAKYLRSEVDPVISTPVATRPIQYVQQDVSPSVQAPVQTTVEIEPMNVDPNFESPVAAPIISVPTMNVDPIRTQASPVEATSVKVAAMSVNPISSAPERIGQVQVATMDVDPIFSSPVQTIATQWPEMNVNPLFTSPVQTSTRAPTFEGIFTNNQAASVDPIASRPQIQ